MWTLKLYYFYWRHNAKSHNLAILVMKRLYSVVLCIHIIWKPSILIHFSVKPCSLSLSFSDKHSLSGWHWRPSQHMLCHISCDLSSYMFTSHISPCSFTLFDVPSWVISPTLTDINFVYPCFSKRLMVPFNTCSAGRTAGENCSLWVLVLVISRG